MFPIIEIKDLMNNFTEVSAVVIKRSINTLAHELVVHARKLGNLIWLADVPFIREP